MANAPVYWSSDLANKLKYVIGMSSVIPVCTDCGKELKNVPDSNSYRKYYHRGYWGRAYDGGLCPGCECYYCEKCFCKRSEKKKYYGEEDYHYCIHCVQFYDAGKTTCVACDSTKGPNYHEIQEIITNKEKIVYGWMNKCTHGNHLCNSCYKPLAKTHRNYQMCNKCHENHNCVRDVKIAATEKCIDRVQGTRVCCQDAKLCCQCSKKPSSYQIKTCDYRDCKNTICKKHQPLQRHPCKLCGEYLCTEHHSIRPFKNGTCIKCAIIRELFPPPVADQIIEYL